jgi:WD40 repeat protein
MGALMSLRVWSAALMLVSITGFAEEPQAPADPPKRPARMVWFPRFSPDGTKLATAHGNWDQNAVGAVRIWDAATGKELFNLPTELGVRSVAWSAKGTVIAAGTYGRAVYFFNAETGAEIGKMPLDANVEVVLISPDEQRMITSFNSGSVIVWNLMTGNPIHNFHLAHKGGVWGLTQSKDGRRLASAGEDGYVRIYDLDLLKVRHELKHPAATNGVAFTPDGTRLLTGCEDSRIRIFDVTSGKEEGALVGHQGGSVTDLQFTSDGKQLASTGMDLTVRLWNTSDLREPVLRETLKAHTKFAFGVAISPKDDLLASAGWDDMIHVWDLATLKEKWSWTWKP